MTTLGDHVIYGGGTLRLTGALDINQNPAFIISEGKFVLDGGVFNSIGGFRIGSFAAASAPVEVVVSNAASLTLEAAGGKSARRRRGRPRDQPVDREQRHRHDAGR